EKYYSELYNRVPKIFIAKNHLSAKYLALRYVAVSSKKVLSLILTKLITINFYYKAPFQSKMKGTLFYSSE
ncbi:hypothetical protein Q2296_09555, partial [Leptospira kirschneri]